MTNNKSSFIIKLEGFIFSLTHYLIVMVSFMLGMFTKHFPAHLHYLPRFVFIYQSILLLN